MRNILPIALLVGAIAGLLVGGFINVFNVPVMEWAIELEGAAAAAESAGEGGSGSDRFLRHDWVPWGRSALAWSWGWPSWA